MWGKNAQRPIMPKSVFFDDDDDIEFVEDKVELDEGELIVFLNEYYTINPDSLPRADFY
jgi:beta-galactosidase beta subunit